MIKVYTKDILFKEHIIRSCGLKYKSAHATGTVVSSEARFLLGLSRDGTVSVYIYRVLLKGRPCLSESAGLHCCPSHWQTQMSTFKRTHSAYKLVDFVFFYKRSRRLKSSLMFLITSCCFFISMGDVNYINFSSLGSRHYLYCNSFLANCTNLVLWL